MKKIYFILVAAALFFAVDANAQVAVGVGYNLLNTKTTMGDDSDDDSLNGFYAEMTYDFSLLKKNWGSLGLQPGVRYTFAGESDSEEVAGVKSKASLSEHYIDVPVNVKYSYEIKPDAFKVYAFAGPVFSLGLASNLKAGVGDSSVKTDNYKDSEYGRFDLKFGLGAGVTLAQKFNVKLGYNIGMLDRYTGDIYKMHTGAFYVGVGYNF